MKSNLALAIPARDRPIAAEVAAPAVGARRAAMRVRSLVEDDLEAVADLFLERFRSRTRNARARADVAAHMKALYLDTPLREDDPYARVALDPAGAVAAFLGGMRMRFRMDGKPVTACVTGALMASTSRGHALAAVQLLRDSCRREYDLVFTDSANRASLAVCQAVNYQVVSPDSLEWSAVFEPASVALHKVRQRSGVDALSALKPFARAVDFAAGAALRAVAGRAKSSLWRDEEVDDETFVDVAPRFYDAFRLRPDWSRAEFLWLVAMARRRNGVGPLRLRLIYDGAGAPMGAYAAYAAKGGVARIFHCVAAPHAWGKLFDNMRESAREWGCIGVHGPMKAPMLAHAYSVRGVFFYYANGTLIHSSRPDVRNAVESGAAMLGGFAGDRWSALAADKFG